MIYEYKFLLSLLFTIIVETIVLILVVRHVYTIDKSKISNSMLIFLGVFCSFATLPYLWFIIPLFIKSRFLFSLVGEILIVLIESIFYFLILRIDIKKAITISLICNLASFLFGLLFIWAQSNFLVVVVEY
jgi:hypothetical protein